MSRAVASRRYRAPLEPHAQSYSRNPPAGREGIEAFQQDSIYDGLANKAAAELETAADSSGCSLEQAVVGVLALAALLLCLYNILVRVFVPFLVLEWSDEVQVYVIVWAMFLILGVVTAADRHVKADLFVGMFSKRVQGWLHIFSDLLGLGFSIMLVYYGALVTWQSYDFGDLSISSLRFPLWIYFAALPAGCLLMAVHYAIRIGRSFQRKGAA